MPGDWLFVPLLTSSPCPIPSFSLKSVIRWQEVKSPVKRDSISQLTKQLLGGKGRSQLRKGVPVKITSTTAWCSFGNNSSIFLLSPFLLLIVLDWVLRSFSLGGVLFLIWAFIPTSLLLIHFRANTRITFFFNCNLMIPRRHRFNPWTRKILHALQQRGLCPTAVEPAL